MPEKRLIAMILRFLYDEKRAGNMQKEKGEKAKTKFGSIMRVEGGKKWEANLLIVKTPKAKRPLTEIRICGESREAVAEQMEQILVLYPPLKREHIYDLSGLVVD